MGDCKQLVVSRRRKEIVNDYFEVSLSWRKEETKLREACNTKITKNHEDNEDLDR